MCAKNKSGISNDSFYSLKEHRKMSSVLSKIFFPSGHRVSLQSQETDLSGCGSHVSYF